jgi:hypothetical protein
MDPEFVIKLDSAPGAKYTKELVETFRAFSLPIFSSRKFGFQEVIAKNLVYWAINSESLRQLKPGQYYIYSGLTADTVSIILKYDKKSFTNFEEISKALDKIVESFGLQQSGTGVVSKILNPLLKNGKYERHDSAYVQLDIADKSVMYKVQALQYSSYSNIGKSNQQPMRMRGEKGNTEFLTYPDNATKGPFMIPFSSKALKVDPNASFPVWLWLEQDPSHHDSLNLAFKYTKDIAGGDSIRFLKERMVNIDGYILHFWKQSGLLADVPVGGSIIKKVYYELYAERATPDENTRRPRVKIFHKNNNGLQTYFRYPEFTVRYLK